jgi:uncharacterized membrane protein YdjX (TVP38/TMEM64 family)
MIADKKHYRFFGYCLDYRTPHPLNDRFFSGIFLCCLNAFFDFNPFRIVNFVVAVPAKVFNIPFGVGSVVGLGYFVVAGKFQPGSATSGAGSWDGFAIQKRLGFSDFSALEVFLAQGIAPKMLSSPVAISLKKRHVP